MRASGWSIAEGRIPPSATRRRCLRILARDLRATTTREGRALSRYCDYLPQLDKIDAVTSGAE